MSDFDEGALRRALEAAKYNTDVARELSESSQNELLQKANDANKEMHRYVVAGAAGSIALIVSRLDSLEGGASASGLVAIAFFLTSLYCSLKTMQARWVEGYQSRAAWAAWLFDTAKVMKESVPDVARGAPIPDWPECPTETIESYQRWSSRAIGTLTGGGVFSLLVLVQIVEWDVPLWISGIFHRFEHLFGWV